MIRFEDGSWPVLDDPDDPWAERWPDDDLGYQDRATVPWLSPPDPAWYRERALAFQNEIDALRRGSPLVPARMLDFAEDLGFSPRWRVDRRPLHTAPRRFSEEEAARIALDFEPASGMVAPDAMLGPWVELVPAERRAATWVFATGHWSAARTHGERPLRAWSHSKPEPPPAERAAANAVTRTPMGIWKLQPVPGGYLLHDLAGLSAHRVPVEPVVPEQQAGIVDICEQNLMLARLIRVGTAWSVWGPLGVPAVPTGFLRAVVKVELLALRLRDRRANVEDALRRSAHHVSRAIHLAAWSHEGNARVNSPRT